MSHWFCYCQLRAPQEDPAWGSVSLSVKWAKNTPQGETNIPDPVQGLLHAEWDP